MHACPRCLDRPLHAHPHDGGTRDDDTADALACSHCGGAWLTAGAAQRVLPVRFGPLARLPAVPTGFAALRCPECHRELARRRVADVDIDVCDAHGVWFDHREVERIRDAAHHDPDRRHQLGGRDTALTTGLLVSAVAFTQSPAPPRMNASVTDVGSTLDATVLVADVALTSAAAASAAGELASSGALEVTSTTLEVTGSAIEVTSTTIEVAGGAGEAAGSGVLDVLAGIFDGLFSL